MKKVAHCKWPHEVIAVPLKCMTASAPLKEQYASKRAISQIHCIYTKHVCKYPSEITAVPIEEWMVATTFVK